MASARFLTLPDVAEILNISQSQTYALVRSGELVAIKIGGRGQWRVEDTQLDEYIKRMYEQTRAFVTSHPFVEGEAAGDEGVAYESIADEGVANEGVANEGVADDVVSAHGRRRGTG